MFRSRTCCRAAGSMADVMLTVIMFAPVTSGLMIGPNNTAVLRGTAMKLTCNASPRDKVIGWGFYTTTYKYYLLDNRCSVSDAIVNDLKTNEDINGYNVGTGNTLPTHAGLYECLVSEVRGSESSVLSRASAYLIVLESNPIGKITKKENNNEITLECSVTYFGLWPPTVEWRFNGNTETDTTLKKGKNRVVATLKKWPTAGKLNYSQYSCVTFFHASNKPENSSASNLPAFNYTWTPHEPRNIKISPRKDTYNHPEQLLCSADAVPEATYSWTNMKTENIINGPNLVVPPADELYIFQCKADNGVGNAATANISFTAVAAVSDKTNNSQTFLIIVYVAGVLGVAILLPLIAICIGKRRCAREQNTPSPSSRGPDSSLARKSRNPRKPTTPSAEPSNAKVEYDDVITPWSDTSRRYMALASRENIPGSDYTEMQIEKETSQI